MKRYIVQVLVILSVLGACKARKNNAGSPVVPSASNVPEEVLESYQDEPEKVAVRPRYNAAATRINDIIHTRLEVSFDIPGSRLFGKATLTVKPYFYPVDSLILDAKAFDINRIQIIDPKLGSKDLAYRYDGYTLRIALDKTYKRDMQYQVFIDYVANPEKVKASGSAAITDAKGLYFIDPKDEDPNKPTQIWTQGETEANSCWFPTIDKPNEKMTQELIITVPSKFVTLSNGIKISSVNNADGTRTDTWRMDLPHAPYLVMMAIGEFAIVKDTWRKIPVDYYVEKEYEPHARAIFGNTPEMMEYFSRVLGVDYPWPKYSQVVVRDFVSGAMENTSASLFGEFVQQTTNELLDNDYESIIAHELFHHWFGDLVTCESWANLPLNESFATLSEYLWYEYKYGRDQADYHNQNNISSYFEESFQKKVPLIRYDYVAREDMFDRHSYQKGGAVLHMLRKYVGDEAFFEALKVYLTENKFHAAEIAHLRLAFEKVAGEDLHWFFDQWFLQKGHPHLETSWNYDDLKHEVVISVKQTQNLDVSPLYKLPLDVDLYTQGRVERKRIVVDSVSQTFRIPLNARPSLVIIDAERTLVGRVVQNLSLEEASFQFMNAPLYMDRFLALEKLIEEPNAPGISEVLKMALRDKFWNIRLLALKSMDDLFAANPAEYKFILTNLAQNDSKTRVRAEAISKLAASWPDDAEVFSLFERMLSDSSSLVQSAALSAMYATNKEKTLEVVQQLENSARGSMLLAIAGIYVDAAVPGKFSFMQRAYQMTTDPNDKYYFIQVMGRYIISQPEAEIRESISLFENIAAKASAWWLRLSGIQVIAEIQNFYEAKVDDLNSEIMTMKEKGTPLSEVQAKEVLRTEYQVQMARMRDILKTIRENEKDSNLSKLLNLMGN